MRTLLMLAFCLIALSGALWAQGLETFNNFDYTGTNYIDGDFVGNNGITWYYYHVTGAVAGANDNSIEGNGMILRRSAVPSRIVSGPIANGITNFSLQMRKAYTSVGDRQLALLINGTWVADSQTFGGASGADPTVHTFTVNGINVQGEFTMEIRNIQGGDINRQVTIDNITWTAYGSGTPYAATPVITPGGGYYGAPVNVSITCATTGASIYYTTNGSDPTQSSSLYSTPIPISSTSTVKARAYAAGHEPSSIATANYAFPVPVNNLGQLRNQPQDGTTVYMVTGEVILTFKQTFRNQKYVQDAQGAILVDDLGGVWSTQYNVNDGITGIVGTIAPYRDMLQFTPVMNPGPASSTNNNVIAPNVTIQQVIGNWENYEARLIRLNNVQFANPTGSFANGQDYPLTDPSGQIIFRTGFYDADYIGTSLPTSAFGVKVICIQFYETYQVTARYLSDFGGVPVEDVPGVVAQTELLDNYPNPFNPSTTIAFRTDQPGPVQIGIYNQKGQLVKSFNIETNRAGESSVVWNGDDDNGITVSSGIYFYRMKSGTYSNTKKMILMK